MGISASPTLGVDDLKYARRRSYRVVLAQLGVTVLAAIICLSAWGAKAGYSAAAGGGIGTFASLYMALRMFGTKQSAPPAELLRVLYIGEVLKLGVTIALFVLVLKVMVVAPLALFGAYIATFAAYWLALLARN